MTKTLDFEMLPLAYARGFFPMPHPDTGDILWFNPDPRAIIPLEKFKPSRSLGRSIRKHAYTFSIDKAFREVMEGCAERKETWINGEFLDAYFKLFERGIAHSVEVWNPNEELVGGLYGVALRGAFFAESKFHRTTDASKAALNFLIEHMLKQGFRLLEVQFLTKHLETLGAVEISSKEYHKLLRQALSVETKF